VAVRLRITYLTNVNFINFRQIFLSIMSCTTWGAETYLCKLALLIYHEWGLAAVIVWYMKAGDCLASWRRYVEHRVFAVEVFHTKQLHRGSSVRVLALSERSPDLSSADFSLWK
jgi:hypothetical protein